METKSNRHAVVTVVCDWCKTSFEKRKQRVQEGKNNFCSRKCCNEWQRESSVSDRIGKENAKTYFDKSRGGYIVQWRDENTNKILHSTWAKWAWETNFGDIPDGHVVSFKDGDLENIVLDNLYIKTPEEIAQETSKRMLGKFVSDESKMKMSLSKKGKPLSDEHKKKIGMSLYARWDSGEFESIHVGKNNHYWKGGTKPYPREFYKIAKFIKSRDNHVCQICGKNVYRSRHGHVHHIDGNKNNNEQDNLILLCSACHSKVHHPTKETPAPILAFSSQLKY